MEKTVIVFINNLDQSRADAVLSFKKTSISLQTNALEDLSLDYDIPIEQLKRYNESKCYVVISGISVREVVTRIPAKTLKQIDKALPHALQDQIVGSEKNTLFKVIEHRFGWQRVYLCNEQLLEKCVNDFSRVNIRIEEIFTELSFSERLVGTYKIILLPHLALVSLGSEIHYACPHEQLKTLLSLSLTRLAAQPDVIQIYAYSYDPAEVVALLDSFQVEVMSEQVESWYLMCAQALLNQPRPRYSVIKQCKHIIQSILSVSAKSDSVSVNIQKNTELVGLLPADLKPKMHPTRILWLACCILVWVTTMIPVATQVVQYYYLKNQFTSLENQIHATYKPLVPGVHSNFSAHEDVLKQLDRQLQMESGDTFLTSLHIISFALVHHPDLTLENVNFDGKKLLFTVKTTTDDDGEIFTERMKGHGVIHKIVVKMLSKQDMDGVSQLHYAMELML